MEKIDLGTFCCIGNSQTGKTSTINTINGSELGAIGTGDGNSVTKFSSFYDINSRLLNSEIQLIDLPGFLDSDLKISDQEIQNLIKMQVSECIGQNRVLKGFLLFESVQNNSITILNCLEKLLIVCGPESRKSVLVLITKVDFAGYFPGRLEGIIQLCYEQRIPFVCWANKFDKLNDYEKFVQINALKFSLLNMMPFKAQWIDHLRNRIVQISVELARNQPIPKYEDIVEKAKQLAREADKVPVNRVRSAIVEVNKEKYIDAKRRRGFMGLDIRNDSVKVTWIDQEVKADTYVEFVKLPYSSFIEAARILCAPKPSEYFEEQASQILKQEIKSFLKN